MPGIFGFILKMEEDRAAEQLARMINTLRHEPFYNDGIWIDESSGIHAGWVARKGSFADGMPLRNERGDVTLLFSGEDYSAPEIAQQLKAEGHQLDCESSAYLVHLYEDDPKFLTRLNGRFHGLLFDHTRGTALLFNDRYGMHRIYYHESHEGFYFASEAKAILAVLPELRSIAPQSLGEFVACGAVLENRTLFRGISLLPPASAWTFRNGELERKGNYFRPKEWEDQEKLDPGTYFQELRSVFARNLPRYFNGRERVAISLTGGLDTRMIMAWHRAAPQSLPCYTFGGMRRDCQDVLVARQVARACKQPFQVIPVGMDFLPQFPHYAERTVYLTDGCADVGHSPDLYLNEKAREVASIRMTGLYGGEVLRRVRTFKPGEPMPGLFQDDMLSYVRRAASTYAELADEHPVSFAIFKQCPWHLYGSLALEQTQCVVRTPFLDDDLIHTVFRAPEVTFASKEVSLRLIADGNKALDRIPTDRGVGGQQGRLRELVSHAVLEFLFKAEYGYDMGMPQWFAVVDRILSPLHLERIFLGRHKIFHFRVWYRDALASYLRDILLDSKSLSRPYLTRNRLEGIVRNHIAGVRNYTNEIHCVLTLELIHRLFIDSSSQPQTSTECVAIAS